ncbi:NAC domain-containing protein 1-like [Telopea speciosissima]|uniref:NAC domain-containing protein 1-like n=1 Tax=Telopea speciosissima TaxID=54955 RepID=UPI001CC5B6E9|nr:NAC domain-containing protein 1-like [Telopea speciosissima]
MSIPSLPAAVRFNPNDTQMLYYLKDKILGRLQLPAGVPDGYFSDNINPYSYDPVELPKGEDFNDYSEAFYFTNKPENRNVKDGFWRASTSPEKIFDNGQMLGFKEEFHFFWSLQSETVNTCWIMHEFSVIPAIFSEDERKANGNRIESYIACRIQYKPSVYMSEEELEELMADD